MDLPPAPTPPVNNGGGSNNMASGSDRTANLLNLLKFSGANAHQQRMQQQAQQSQSSPQSSPQTSQPPQEQQLHQEVPQQQQQQSVSSHNAALEEAQRQSLDFRPNEFGFGHYNGYISYVNPNDPNAKPEHEMEFDDEPQPPQQEEEPVYPEHPGSPRIHQPMPSAADPTGLLAALMRGAHDNDAEDSPKPQHSHVQHAVGPLPQVPSLPQAANSSWGPGSPAPDTRSFLLNLLNRPKPGSNEHAESRSDNHTPQSPNVSDHGQPRWRNSFQHDQPSQPSAYAAAHAAAQQYQASKTYGDFHYAAANAASQSSNQGQSQGQEPTDVNALYRQLMGSLAHSSPQSHHSVPKDQPSPAGSLHRGSQRAPSEPSSIARSPDLSRHLGRTSSHYSHHSHHSHHSTVKQTPTSTEFDRYPSTENKETVSAAVSDIAGQADRDAREALDRAEHEQNEAEISEGLDNMLQAKSEKEFDEGAHTAAQALKHELDRSDNEGVLESTLPQELADAVNDIVEETAQVADSWESADQDEIVVIEEADVPAVKVHNFPMKPWISITLQDETSVTRPVFRKEAVMEIARLKKDFDQIDRNLYTASRNYMTYGMSKQGGLRVIRQEDGRDAKVFTDTKDRIFNVAMSITPQDHEGPQKEAIIGTGISGTVYWVKIKEGEKDHIEDAHLEQYGFALPPISSQEGDTPGGVLKTRARASTIHPEYFAVGRGKSINFIWPSYIMQNNLFKPGHDRVVDTEQLLQQCSLKINTGKAGKDFTFSQDDSVVVSLDKSGRVKFWDVRDLTAVKEYCDPRHPVPAHSSLEVKEPLMTLASTPEGEKAWPTSVLLLDKQRPYQKRCALRYMIVGMKQNHTLQLWDLALGKPVQEFNLPHSKESDAVCSVMYHPASGMIIIGHPTRNSIYFAHLSAPKYNLKSVSQAEYIQRLVAQDSSLPQPDSTAVISGIREYSLEDRGILRSLDILCNPNSSHENEGDEPALFELYAMHSRGVACLLIKQHELGWSKDNKVLAPVDAVSEGVVVVSKLKSPQTSESEQSQASNGNGSRTVIKESLAANASSQSDGHRGVENVIPIRTKTEAKDPDAQAHSSKENQPEKSERRSRKKKAGNAEPATNGGAVPRNVSASKPEAKAGNNAMSSEALETAITGMETRLGANLADTFKHSLSDLHGMLDEGVRVRDQSFNQHQQKLLDMVSDVLNENTQKVLESLIHQQFTDLVIPAIGDKAGRAVTDLLNSKLPTNVSNAVQKEVQAAMPHAVNRALRSNDFVDAISDRVAAAVQGDVMSTITQQLSQNYQGIATSAAQRVAGDMHKQYQEQFERLNAQRAADSQKIDQLTNYVTQLMTTISTMATTQQSIQEQFIKLKQTPVHELPGATSSPGPRGYGAQHPMDNYGAPIAAKPSSHAGSFTGSQGHGQMPSGHHPQGYMNPSPQYSRSARAGHITSPQGSGVLSEQTGGASSVSAIAGAFANQRNKAGIDADHDLNSRIRLIEQHITEGRLQDAIIQWIQSGREVAIFRDCLIRHPASKFESLSPLILLVMLATISKNLKPNPLLKQEMEWIEMAIRSFSDQLNNSAVSISFHRFSSCTNVIQEWDKPGMRDVLGSTPSTLHLLISRVKPILSSMQDGYPTDPFVAKVDKHKLEWIVITSGRLLETFGNMGSGGHMGRYD